jgi:hypothetical protein
VSTSSAPFQVTAGAEPEDTVPTTTTVTTAPPESFEIPLDPGERSTTGPGARTSGVDGGLDPVMADTTGEPAAPRAGAVGTGQAAGAGSPGSSVPTAGASEDGSTTTTTSVPSPPRGDAATGPAAVVPGAPDVTAAPGTGRGSEAGGAALARSATSQSSGAVRSPLLLMVGLGLVFGGGVFLAVRNRVRIGGRGPSELG